MTKPHYAAALRIVKITTNPSTGGPRPLQITLVIPSYATGLAILRDIADNRLPITLHIETAQPPLPEPYP
jgi:hypothetical protein